MMTVAALAIAAANRDAMIGVLAVTPQIAAKDRDPALTGAARAMGLMVPRVSLPADPTAAETTRVAVPADLRGVGIPRAMENNEAEMGVVPETPEEVLVLAAAHAEAIAAAHQSGPVESDAWSFSGLTALRALQSQLLCGSGRCPCQDA